MEAAKRESFVQLIKYACVGVLNTLVTLILIFLCKSILGVNAYVSNGIGYVGGVINSFLWNRNWVFKSSGGYTRQAVLFLIGFFSCYAIQLLVLWLINKSWFGSVEYDLFGIFTISGYGIATLIGMVVYTLCNFIYNKIVTFK